MRDFTLDLESAQILHELNDASGTLASSALRERLDMSRGSFHNWSGELEEKKLIRATNRDSRSGNEPLEWAITDAGVGWVERHENIGDQPATVGEIEEVAHEALDTANEARNRASSIEGEVGALVRDIRQLQKDAERALESSRLIKLRADDAARAAANQAISSESEVFHERVEECQEKLEEVNQAMGKWATHIEDRMDEVEERVKWDHPRDIEEDMEEVKDRLEEVDDQVSRTAKLYFRHDDRITRIESELGLDEDGSDGYLRKLFNTLPF